jgi:hypothetical protein
VARGLYVERRALERRAQHGRWPPRAEGQERSDVVCDQPFAKGVEHQLLAVVVQEDAGEVPRNPVEAGSAEDSLSTQLVDLLNLKASREMSELILRRWPDSARGRHQRAEEQAEAEAARGEPAAEQLKSARRTGRAGSGYFIKVAGTAEGPVPADWAVAHGRWVKQFGEASTFSRRPRVNRGDRFISYAVGSYERVREGRIYLVSEVVSAAPEPSPHPRWPWMVRTHSLIAGPRLEHCPTITEIDVDRSSLRRQSHIHLTDQQGQRAEVLIARAAEQFGSLRP